MSTDKESFLVLGPAGTGKSHFAGSVCDVVEPSRVLLLCPKPREKTSHLYRKHGLTERAEVFSDLRTWRPDKKQFGATAWTALFDRVDGLIDDEQYEAVILDPLTDAIELLDHHILSPSKVGSPGDLGDTRAYYRQLKDKSRELVDRLVALTIADIAVKRTKWVIVTMHTQPPKEDQMLSRQQGGGTKPSADALAEGIEYEGKALPQIEGSYRRKMMADFGVCLFAGVESAFDVASKSMKTKYTMQALADADKHAKVAPIPAEMLTKQLPNEFKAIYDILLKAAT